MCPTTALLRPPAGHCRLGRCCRAPWGTAQDAAVGARGDGRWCGVWLGCGVVASLSATMRCSRRCSAVWPTASACLIGSAWIWASISSCCTSSSYAWCRLLRSSSTTPPLRHAASNEEGAKPDEEEMGGCTHGARDADSAAGCAIGPGREKVSVEAPFRPASAPYIKPPYTGSLGCATERYFKRESPCFSNALAD